MFSKLSGLRPPAAGSLPAGGETLGVIVSRNVGESRNGGGGGNRTRVRRTRLKGFYVRSLGLGISLVTVGTGTIRRL